MLNWLIGARAERKVGAELERLRDSGWLILQGTSATGAVTLTTSSAAPRHLQVETKSYEFRRSDLRRAAWNAAWMKEEA